MVVIFGISWASGIAAASGQATADAWWVWLPGRAEARDLASGFQPGERIYWHTATLTWSRNGWRDTERPEPSPPSAPSPAASADGAGRTTQATEMVPVLRLQSAGAVEVDAAWPPVLERLKEMRERSGAAWVQLDCDCPDRLLPVYARRLADLRRGLAPGKLSVTALAGWAPLLNADLWKTAADELTPMFYDLEPDRPDEILSGRVRPLVEPEICARWLPAWQALGIPWRCGLANFRRLSRFKSDGTALGHFPNWDPAPLLSCGTALGGMERVGPGAWRWKVLENVRLSGAARGAEAGDWLVFREPDLSALTKLEAAALAAGLVEWCGFRDRQGG